MEGKITSLKHFKDDIKEAKEYQNKMRQQGIVIKVQKIIGGYRATRVGEAYERKNESSVNGRLNEILEDED